MALSKLDLAEIEYSHLNLNIPKIDFSKLRKPFPKYRAVEDYMEVMQAIRDPANFYFTCKNILNVEPTVFQLVWLEQLWKYPFPMVIANRGASKTFTIALYLMLRALITQGSKSVITSATFRQAKYVFDYMETIWGNAPVLRDICGDTKGQGPSRGTDTWVFKIGHSTCTAIPLGTGEKIRGLCAQYVICEEFNCLAADTLCETNEGLLRISDAVKRPDILLLNKDGVYEKPIRFIKTPPTEVYEVITEGLSFKCSSKHKVLTKDGFKLAKDLVEGDYIISDNKYKFPTQSPIDEDTAHYMGLSLMKYKRDLPFSQRRIPCSILESSEKIITIFLGALFTNNTYNFFENNVAWTEYYAESKQLCQEIQILLRKLGHISTLKKSLNQYVVTFVWEKTNRGAERVLSVKLLPDKEVLYDFELPLTHSFYANGMVQHNSINPDIFEIVLRGFTATSSNPVENIKNFAKIKKLKEKELWTPEHEEKIFYKPNQIILSGTAGFEFQHFAKYWKRYHDIITSKGDPDKLHQALGSYPGKGFSHKDYCIIRVPVDLLPEGMMEDKAVENSRVTMDKGRFDCEFNAIFSKDSNGFFRRSLIESCTTSKPILLTSGEVQFIARLNGEQGSKYVMGVDPASESDNFAISILEVCSDHLRVVYGWTINRRKAFKIFTDKKSSESSFYSFVNRKIRSLMQSFQIEYIGLDSGGGGIGVLECLHDHKNLESGDLPIFPLRQDDPLLYPGSKDYGYDDEAGLHIVDMINFAKSEWVVEYNHGMRKALENKTLLFPHIDSLSLTIAETEDKTTGREIDTLGDVIYEIEQTKEELSCIVHSSSLTGRDKWETPSMILQGGKIGKMRKDRYSALLIAFSVASRMSRPTKTQYIGTAGGFASQCANRETPNNKMYTGSEWFCGSANRSSVFGQAITRGSPR